MKKVIMAMMMAVLIVCALLTGCGASTSEDSDDSTQTSGKDSRVYVALKEGDAMRDFTAEVNDGSSFTLSDHEGEVILLNFWATWCGPCVEEMPAFQKLYEEYGDKISILAVDVSEDKETVDSFLADKDYTFPIAYDEDGSVSNKYPTEGIPYTLVIGKDGTVKNIFVGAKGADEQYKKYRSALKEAFSEQQ